MKKISVSNALRRAKPSLQTISSLFSQQTHVSHHSLLQLHLQYLLPLRMIPPVRRLTMQLAITLLTFRIQTQQTVRLQAV